MLESICEETFIADRAYLDQGTMHAPGKKVLAETCQRRRVASAEHVWRNRKVELIDQVLF